MKTKEFKPGELVETYTIGHLLRKRIIVKNEKVLETDPYFKFENVSKNPGLNDEMLRGVFGTTLKVVKKYYPIENTVCVESNYDGTAWYLPLEAIKK